MIPSIIYWVLFVSIIYFSGGTPDIFCAMLIQCELNVSTILLSLSIKASLFLIDIKSLPMQLLFVKNGLTKFQNCLLEEMLFFVLLLRYFISDFLQTELHLCFIFFIFTKFSAEGFFRHLFRSRDLSTIAFLSYFVINGALFPLTLICFIGACSSVIVLKRLEKSYYG